MPFPYTFAFSFEDHYSLAVDWNGDNLFGDGTGEDVTGRALADAPITISRGRDQIRQLAPPMAGNAEAELYNSSKDYSPDYASGPLYGNLVPGRQVRIRTSEGATMRNLFHGYLDDIPQHPERPELSVSIPCLGSLSKLRGQADGQKISTPLYQNITTDQALGYILDALSWSSSTGSYGRSLQTGKTTLAWWWLDDEDAFSAAVDLLNTEGPGAALYEDGLGRIVFEDRHYRLLTARCTASQATFSAAATTGPLISPPFAYNPRLKDVINSCTVTQKTRAAGSTGEVWALGETITLAPGESRAYLARASDPWVNASIPSTSGTDYVVSAGGLATTGPTLNRTSGQSCTITFTAGTAGATLTGLRLRAQSVTVTNTNQVANTVSSTASRAKYGLRSYPLNVRAEVDINTVQDFTNAVVGIYQEPRATMQINVVGASTTNLEQVLAREISDRVTIVEPQSGINAGFFVEQIGHNIAYGGNLHSAVFGCEKASTTLASYFILDTSVLDGSDILAF